MTEKKLSPAPLPLAEATMMVDKQWRVTFFNRQAEELLCLQAEDVLGKDCHDAFHEHDHFTSLCNLYGPLASGHSLVGFRMVVESLCTGEATPVVVYALPMPDKDGNLQGALIVFSEVMEKADVSRLAMDSVADGVFTVDERWRITSFNKAAEHMTGWLSAEVIGKKCCDIFLSSGCENNCVLANSIRDRSPLVGETVFMRTKTGLSLPVSISAAPLLDNFGQIVGGVETFRDITSALTNELILDSVADGVFTVDRDWRITSFNKGAEIITGYNFADVEGKSCKDVFHSSVCGDACVLRQSIAEGREIVDKSIFVKGKDGASCPVSISAAPLIDHEGNVIGGVETFRDISSSIKNDLILDSVSDGVFTVDRNWQITSFNRAAEIITGWHRDDAIGTYCSEVFCSSICGKSCAIAQSIYSGEPVNNRSITIKNRKGNEVPVSISAAPLVDHEGNILGGVETFRDLSILDSLRKQLTMRYTFGEIISKAASMQRIFNILPEIARSPSNVLVLGDSGTGKELVARAVYNASSRSKKPFVIVNCGALPDTLLESELFGYKAGAFTDAKQDRAGRFAMAEGGTIFLDEIGDIPQSLQVKLLRVLQQKVYEPLGSNEPVKADVRIIAATNRDLHTLVKEGVFREDLYYRLNVVKIHLPPLRERKEDIPLLIDHFITKFRSQQNKDISGIAASAADVLMRYDYPGNIRELENIIEYAFILCPGGFIQPEHLPEPFSPKLPMLSPAEGVPESKVIFSDEPLLLAEIEKQAIFAALERNKWKKMATCRELGVSKDTLRRKISRYDLQEPS